MSNPLAQLRGACQRLLEEALSKAYPGVELPSSKFSRPPNPEMGELSTPVCFQLARRLRSSPPEIADKIVKHIGSDSKLIESAEALNGYINFHADMGAFAELVLETATTDEDYGFLKVPEFLPQ